MASRAGRGALIATSAISKAHEWAKLESPCQDTRGCASLNGWDGDSRRPQRQSGALTAVQPRRRGRGIETAEQSAETGRFDVVLAAVLSDAGLRRSEAAALAWGDVQRWDDGSGGMVGRYTRGETAGSALRYL